MAHPRTRTGLAQLVLITLVFAGFAIPALARPAQNQALVVISPATANAGATQFSVSITNNATIQLGSANVTVPADIDIVSFSTDVGVATLNGKTIQLRFLDLQPGESANVTVDTNVACVSGDRVWQFVGKQSSTFVGASNFGLASGSNVVTHMPGACDFSLAFVTQPTNAAVNETITGEPFNQAGTPVSVGLVDSGGNVVTTASAAISLAIGANTGGGMLQGVTSADTVDGVASFPGIFIDATGLDYTLVASADGEDPVESNTFVIADDGLECTGSTCTASATAGSTTATVTANGLTPSDTVFVVLDVETLDCPNYEEISSVVTFESTGNKKKRITITVQNPPPRDGGFEVCYESPTPFTDNAGNVVTLGLLPGCGSVNKIPPCIVQKTTTPDQVTITFNAPAGDPKGRV
ncbi:MAG TPA: hypothetical protein VH989_08085 [Actinomycetota bacterium]